MLKRGALALALMATTALPAARPAEAATATATFAVTATVLNLCLITAAPLAFGNYTATTQLDATTTLLVTCTFGTTYTIGLDAGTGTGATTAQRRMTNGTSLLNYALYSDSTRSTIWGNTTGTNTVAGTGTGLPQALSVYGRIPAGQYVTPGAYLDTVTATLTY